MASKSLSETLKSQPDVSQMGEYTQELSDVYEYEREEPTALTKAVATLVSKKSDSRGPSKEEITQKFQKRVSQFKKDVGHVFFSDLRLIFRILFFFASIGVLVLALIRFGMLSKELVAKYGDIPICVFQWSEWGDCSAECSSPNQTATRTRFVIPETVVDMSNIKKDAWNAEIFYYIYVALHRSECYKIQQTTPCNVYECPVNLSTLTEFTPCQYSIVSSEKPQCIQYRIVPPRGLVRIDKPVEMFKFCNCSDAKYPF